MMDFILRHLIGLCDASHWSIVLFVFVCYVWLFWCMWEDWRNG